MALRPSREDDLAWVTALERHPDNVPLIGQWTDDEHLRAIHRRDGWEHWIIERDGQPAGFVIAFDGRMFGGWIYVKRVLVAQKGRGTGTAAFGRLLEELATRPGVKFVWLNVRQANLPAQAVYLRHGLSRFEPGEELAERLAQCGDVPGPGVMRMWRPLGE